MSDDVRFFTGDIEAGYTTQNAQTGTELRWLMGVRAGYFELNRGNPEFPGTTSGVNSLDGGAVKEHSRFIGVGPRVGVFASVPLNDGPYTFEAGASGGVLIGELDYTKSVTTVAGTSFRASESSTEVVFFADANIGVSRALSDRVTLEAGWNAKFTGNALKSTTEFTDTSSPGTPLYERLDRGLADFISHGPYFRLTAYLD